MNPTDSKLLDSCAWLSYFFAESEKIREIIESGDSLSISVLSLYEIERRLIKLKYNENNVDEFLNFIQSRAIVIPLEIDTCRAAVKLSLKNGLGAMDALILASANVSKATLLTADYDFKGLKGVQLIQ